MAAHDNINHALEKIDECVDELSQVAFGSSDYNHSLFQMSYNIGRLSELTGTGRKLYDEVKGDIASGDWEFVGEAVNDFVLAQ